MLWGEDKIKKVLNESPIKLLDDYIGFLRVISGGENVEISFQVDVGDLIYFYGENRRRIIRKFYSVVKAI